MPFIFLLFMLTHSWSTVLQVDPKSERILHIIRREIRAMAKRRTLQDHFTATVELTDSIANSAMEANNFELKLALIAMVRTSVQFRGLPTEDPNAHLKKFVRMTDTIKYNGVSANAIRTRLFPFSLADKAMLWLSSLPDGSITSWDQLTCRFLAKFFPPSKSAKLKADITNFSQYEHESLCEAWERFQDMLRRCLHHGFSRRQQIQILYNGLSAQNRSSIDVACRGTMFKKTPEEVYSLIEEMASNNYQWPSGDRHVEKQVGVYQVDAIAALDLKLDVITKMLETLMQAQSQFTHATLSPCERCGLARHDNQDCQVGNPWAKQVEEANHVSNSNRNQNDPYSSTYNPGRRNHPNFSWGGQQKRQNPNVYKPPHLQNQWQKQEERKPYIHDTMAKFIEKTDDRFKTLETQISSLVTLMSQRAQGSLPTQTEPNPKEETKAITFRSGKELNEEANKEERVSTKRKEALNEESSSEENKKGKVDHELEKVQIPYP